MAARSEAPNDPRPYIRVALDLPMNPKLAAIEENFHACGWAYICSLCYCGQSLTDGHFPMRAVLRMADVVREQVMALVEQGLWHLPDHGCPDCEQPKSGHVVIHDYLQHQRSAAEVHDLSAKRREAGKKGAEKRWAAEERKRAASHPTINSPYMASAMASAIANAQNEPWQTDGKSMTEEMRGDESEESNTRPPAAPSDTGALFDETQTGAKVEKPKQEKPKRPTEAQAMSTPEWQEFWYRAFPRKDGRPPAVAAWIKATFDKKVDPQVIIAGARSYARRMALEQTERSKIKMAQGWLNDRRWEDEADDLDTAGPSDERCPVHPRQLRDACGPCASEAKVRDREAVRA